MTIELKNTLTRIVILLTIIFSLNYVQASTQAEASVRAVLLKWMADFNSKNTKDICNLFSPQLHWAILYPGYEREKNLEHNYADMCNGLQRVLRDKKTYYHYSADIKEVITSGNLAVVRVVWTFTTRPSTSHKTHTSKEFSLDVLQQEPDKITWKMTNFVAYEVPSTFSK